ncbi:pneumococcal serine-rich repeat protein isoform X1 [Dermacentor silvarum]|uniref:pneumococcal serine-rich repeat protein isoform X1 n=2 Tax=Dermacentor silvarum TaxID=543639 RepID=UPI002100B0E7|nr:pneumococcal serine-rich repeat protein isoform X1 [Dermacentor silvarum]
MSSLCRSSPFSSRTKSLREKFASKRSYSESFKDPPPAAVGSATSSAAQDASSTSSRSPPRPESGPGYLSHCSGSADAASGLVMPPSLPGFMPSYTVMPEDAYCSALDINCQQGDPRFPWQRDAAVQCDLRGSSLVNSRSSTHIDGGRCSPGLSSLIRPSSPAAAARAAISGSSVGDIFSTSAAGSPPTPPPRRSTPALQRALSLERSAARKKGASSLLAGHASASASPGSQLPPALEEGGTANGSASVAAGNAAARAASCSPQRAQQQQQQQPPVSPDPNASPKSGQASPAFTRSSPGETTPPLTRRPSAAERRKMCFVRKQTNSAPNSMDEEVPSPSSSSVCSGGAPSTASSYLSRNTSVASAPMGSSSCGTGSDSRPGYFNFESMQRLLDLSMKVPGERKSFYLDIPSQEGLGACRDGKAAYLSLPSPNLQTEEQESSIVFKKLSKPEEEEDEQDEFVEPPASALHRRQALVPPKMLTDGYESSSEDISTQGSVSNDQNTQKTRRRSSIVVIPPMQICPGDLLVYSKVLTHRNNLLADIDGSTQCLAVSEDSSRKAKNTWSLLRLFDRANRAKTECLGGLEEVLSTLRPSEFCDEQLAKYKGMTWDSFVASLKKRDAGSDDEDEDESSSGGAGSPRSGGATSSSATAASYTIAAPEGAGCLSVPGEADRGSPTGDAMQSQFLRTINQTIQKNEAKKKEALWELFQSECNFLEDHLMVLKNVFMEPLKKIQVEGYAMFAEPEVLFGNLDELCCVTYAFCREFINFILASHNSGEFSTTDVLIRLFKKSTKAAALRQAYHRYTLNYINALNYLETLRRQVEFNEFEKWCARDPRCKKLQLTDLLVSPVQHIMRVPLILKDIEMRTEDMEERDCITAILETEENSLRELDDKMKWLKNFERLLEIQRNIVWPPVTELDSKLYIPEFLKVPLSKQPCERLIVSPRRQIILEGPLQMLDTSKSGFEVYVVLFDDMILITRKKKGLSKKKSSLNLDTKPSQDKKNNAIQDGVKYIVYKQPLSLDRICIHDVSAQEGAAQNLKNVFVFVCLNRFQQIITVHTLQASNESTKLTWLTKLRDTVDRWKRTLQNTVFRNQRIPANSSAPPPPK